MMGGTASNLAGLLIPKGGADCDLAGIEALADAIRAALGEELAVRVRMAWARRGAGGHPPEVVAEAARAFAADLLAFAGPEPIPVDPEWPDGPRVPCPRCGSYASLGHVMPCREPERD